MARPLPTNSDFAKEPQRSGSAMSSLSDSSSTEHLSHGIAPKARFVVSPHWLLWLGLGAAATAGSCGFPQEVNLSLGAAFVVVWALVGVTPKQMIALGVDALIELYFREYMVIGEEKVPSKGAVIFVCGPHSNQFLDPCVVSRGTERDIRYIIAAKSLRRKDLGWLFKYADPVPVERQQDLKRAGRGKVTVKGDRVVGIGTKFLEDFAGEGKFQILVAAPAGEKAKPAPARVKEILGDDEILLEAEAARDRPEPSKFHVLPPVKHDVMFESVYSHLGGGGALGIFPEGGSHDRTELLPLKVGVCLMALGAMEKYPESPVHLVPVGLNYFSQHKFNSRVLVKYGDPIAIKGDGAILRMFKSGGDLKKRAVGDLLRVIEAALRRVTVQAPDFATLKTFWVVRDLYCPTKRLLEMSSVDQVLLAQAFASDYHRVREDPAVDPLLDRIRNYSRKLSGLGLRDKGNIKTALLVKSHSKANLLILLVLRCLYVFLLLVVFLPIFLALFPVYVVASKYSTRKSAEAVAASTVKIKGRDVMGTYKLLIAIPMLLVGHLLDCFLLRWSLGEAPAMAYFFFAPFAQFLVYKRIPELVEYLRVTRTLAFALFTKDQTKEIVKERERLKTEVRELVDRVQWGFDSELVREHRVRRSDTHDSFRLDDFEDFEKTFSKSMAKLYDFTQGDIHDDLLYKND
mmetsp:Transcript_7354/g.22038  ORF Transcript_7354/g.22038 Transcript_7354/m.22038 type:complete len:686 (-) Transcript_7354:134-2191(-)